MENTETTVVETTNAGSVKADWSALSDFSQVVVTPTEAAPVIEENKPEEIKIEEVKPEAKAEEVKPEAKTDEVKPEVKTEEVKPEDAESGALEFKADDVSDVPQTYEDGTFKALAHDLFKIDLADESPEAFQKAFVPRTELEKLQNVTLDTVLSNVKPEVATALKLMEMGMSAETVLQPTRELDAYLAMDDAALVRADLELQTDLTPAIIDDMMEKLSESPDKLKLESDKLRIYINREKAQIVEERKQYLQKYESDKQNAMLHQKTQERTQVIDAMNKISEYMGFKVSKEATEAFIMKYNNGLYDNDLSSPTSKAQFIFQKEMQEKLTKHIQNKASETAKKEATNKLLNIPPLVTGAGQKVDTSKQPTDNPWGALSEDFKK